MGRPFQTYSHERDPKRPALGFVIVGLIVALMIVGVSLGAGAAFDWWALRPTTGATAAIAMLACLWFCARCLRALGDRWPW